MVKFVGPERYSIPQCQRRARPNEYCHAGQLPEDRELFYPNQDIRRVEEVYAAFCPCQDGYKCKKSHCSK